MVWTIATYLSGTGGTPFEDWLAKVPLGAQAAIDDRLFKMEALSKWSEKWASSYKGYPGLFELRIPHNKVQYRPLGAYSPHPSQRYWFVIVAGAIEKGGKIPKSVLDTAANRVEEMKKDPKRARPYEG